MVRETNREVMLEIMGQAIRVIVTTVAYLRREHGKPEGAQVAWRGIIYHSAIACVSTKFSFAAKRHAAQEQK